MKHYRKAHLLMQNQCVRKMVLVMIRIYSMNQKVFSAEADEISDVDVPLIPKFGYE